MKLLLGAVLLGSLASAQALTQSYIYSGNTLLLDGPAGFTEIPVAVDGKISQITDLNMRLRIQGGNLLDVGAVTLRGDGSLGGAVLFDSLDFVSSSDIFDVWFDDDPSAPSIATYSFALNGGTFQPVTPLDAFNGAPAADIYLLVFSDLGNSDLQGNVIYWELEITGLAASAVPETIPFVPAFSLLSLVAFDAFRRRARH